MVVVVVVAVVGPVRFDSPDIASLSNSVSIDEGADKGVVGGEGLLGGPGTDDDASMIRRLEVLCGCPEEDKDAFLLFLTSLVVVLAVLECIITLGGGGSRLGSLSGLCGI